MHSNSLSIRRSRINDFGFGTVIASALSLRGGRVILKKSNAEDIPGTIIFNGTRAIKGYPLNKMCFSFNSAENRDAYRRDEDAYCDKFELTDQQRQALKHRNVRELLEAGGNIYYLAKWAGIFGMNVQQIGAQQRGMTEEEFKEMLVRAGGD
jgi:protocatechuate 4,5-dioxygenase, alpha chain